MLETMLDLFYAFIFVAGAAGLAVIATLGTTFTTAGDARRPSASVTGKLVQAVVPLRQAAAVVLTLVPRDGTGTKLLHELRQPPPSSSKRSSGSRIWSQS
jgi:hypothetical protein